MLFSKKLTADDLERLGIQVKTMQKTAHAINDRLVAGCLYSLADLLTEAQRQKVDKYNNTMVISCPRDFWHDGDHQYLVLFDKAIR